MSKPDSAAFTCASKPSSTRTSQYTTLRSGSMRRSNAWMRSAMVKRRPHGNASEQWGPSGTKARNWCVIHLLASQDFYLALSCKDTQAEEISNKLSNLKSAENARAKKIRDTEANILKMKAEVAPRDVESTEDIEEESVCSLLPFCPNAWHLNELGAAPPRPK
jgi:hypothetical protein